jgi:hypothetical protein
MANGVNLDIDYLEMKLRNAMRFDYSYAMFGSQVSSYQDATGLLVHPGRTDFVKIDKNYYKVLEISPKLMGEIVDHLTIQFNYYDAYDLVGLELSPKQVLEQLIDDYLKYEILREKYPDDFFSSGDCVNYQKLNQKPLYDESNYVPSIYDLSWAGINDYQFMVQRYEYSEDFEEVDGIDELEKYFVRIQNLSFSKEHYDYLGYDNLFNSLTFNEHGMLIND